MIVAIIQARMGSTRLPGKVMLKVMGRSMLSFMIERLRFCKSIDKIVIATTTSEQDWPIVQYCIENNISYYQGSENDVLDRFYQTAKEYNAENIIRLTGDCPLIDPEVIDELVARFIKEGDLDHMNTGATYPEGVDAEVVSFSALEDAWKNATLSTEREHVTAHIWANPDKFKTKPMQYTRDLSKYRYTVDEPSDFEVVKSIFLALYEENEIFLTETIIEYLDSHPEVFQLNQGIIRNEGLMKSIEKEEGAGVILDDYKKMRKLSDDP